MRRGGEERRGEGGGEAGKEREDRKQGSGEGGRSPWNHSRGFRNKWEVTLVSLTYSHIYKQLRMRLPLHTVIPLRYAAVGGADRWVMVFSIVTVAYALVIPYILSHFGMPPLNVLTGG